MLGGIAAAQTSALLGSGSAPVEATAGRFRLLFFGVAGFAAIGAIVTAAVRSQ
ncbi:hypothetical protein [Leifsonia sp. LS1]|uniref:hypothetical protein n=1 Tax=Leifsonia sp. LS1 TaxID=2828483 RepID=UPI001CFD006B|nr:hypothetical protein [Leifsonia sp. LS1]